MTLPHVPRADAVGRGTVSKILLFAESAPQESLVRHYSAPASCGPGWTSNTLTAASISQPTCSLVGRILMKVLAGPKLCRRRRPQAEPQQRRSSLHEHVTVGPQFDSSSGVQSRTAAPADKTFGASCLMGRGSWRWSRCKSAISCDQGASTAHSASFTAPLWSGACAHKVSAGRWELTTGLDLTFVLARFHHRDSLTRFPARTTGVPERPSLLTPVGLAASL